MLRAGLPALARTVDEEPVVVHAHDVASDVVVAVALLFGPRSRRPGPHRSPGSGRRDVATSLGSLLRLRSLLLRPLLLRRQRLLLLVGAHAAVQVLLEGVEVTNGRRWRRLLEYLVRVGIVRRLRLRGSNGQRRSASLRRARGEHGVRVEDLGHQEAHPAGGLVAQTAVDEVAPARPAGISNNVLHAYRYIWLLRYL